MIFAALLSTGSSASAKLTEHEEARGQQPQIVTCSESNKIERAIKGLNSYISTLIRHKLDIIKFNGATSLERPSIVISTRDGLPAKLGSIFDKTKVPIDGFAIKSCSYGNGVSTILICGSNSFNTSVAVNYFRDNFINPLPHLELDSIEIDLVKSAAIENRVAFTETWCDYPFYPVNSFKRLLDKAAEFGFTTWSIFASGLYDSVKFPEQKVFEDTTLDNTAIKELIDYAHSLGMKVEIGTGIWFWRGACKILNHYVDKYPEIRATGRRGGMCPSNRKSRQLMLDYVMDLAETFPEADSILIEPSDEQGECLCDTCQTKLDGFGSHQYGQSQVSFYKQLAGKIWERWPKKTITIMVGFENFSFPGQRPAHTGDVKYYEELQKWNDERIWLNQNYNNFYVVGQEGRLTMPLEQLSDRVSYSVRGHGLRVWRKLRQRGINGYLVGFNPDKAEMPLKKWINLIIAREFSWESNEQASIVERIHRNLFGSEVPADLTKAIMSAIRDIENESVQMEVNGAYLFTRPYVEEEIAKKLVQYITNNDNHTKEEAERWSEYLKRLERKQATIENIISQIESRIDNYRTQFTPKTAHTMKHYIGPWIERTKREYLLTEAYKIGLKESLSKLSKPTGNQTSITYSNRGGIRLWEVFNPDNLKGRDFESISTVVTGWEKRRSNSYPDQITLPRLDYNNYRATGYARTSVHVKEKQQAYIKIGMLHAGYGNRTKYTIWCNGKIIGKYDEIQGGYVSNEDRGFIYVPLTQWDELQTYICVDSHETELKKGGNEILIMFEREFVPSLGSINDNMPFSFDMRLVDGNGKPLQNCTIGKIDTR